MDGGWQGRQGVLEEQGTRWGGQGVLCSFGQGVLCGLGRGRKGRA